METSGVRSWLRPGFFVKVLIFFTMKCQKWKERERAFQKNTEHDRKKERGKERGREGEQKRTKE
jgi:hypothetical protein